MVFICKGTHARALTLARTQKTHVRTLTHGRKRIGCKALKRTLTRSLPLSLSLTCASARQQTLAVFPQAISALNAPHLGTVVVRNDAAHSLSTIGFSDSKHEIGKVREASRSLCSDHSHSFSAFIWAEVVN